MKTEPTYAPLYVSMLRVLLGTAAVLLIPFVAMHFNSDVQWDSADFIVIGGLLCGAGTLYTLVTRNVKNTRRRIAIGLIVAAVVMWLWAELAVGIFTNWGS